MSKDRDMGAPGFGSGLDFVEEVSFLLCVEAYCV
jgi:hypothetical protein